MFKGIQKITFLHSSTVAITAILMLLPGICFTKTSLSTNTKVYLIPLEGEAEKIAVDLDLAKMAGSIKIMLEDLGEATLEQGIPLNIRSRTLKAIVAALEGTNKLRDLGLEQDFETMKELVKNSLEYNATSDDILNFILAANYLDIGDKFFQPSAALFVDSFLAVPKSHEEWDGAATRLEQILKKYKIPQELLTFFSKYIRWFENPSPNITQPISSGNSPNAIMLSGTKLYVAIPYGDGIEVFDTKTAKKIHTIDANLGATTFLVNGTVLYVGNDNNNSVLVIDTKTDKMIKSIALNNVPVALAASDTKLYALSPDGISIIDIQTNDVLQTIPIGGNGLAISGAKIYVSDSAKNNVLVINKNSYESDQIIEVGKFPSQLAVLGSKLYVANTEDNSISVIDTLSDTVKRDPILVKMPGALTVSDSMLFVASYDTNKVSVIDTKTDKIIQNIPVGAGPIALAASDTELYVANFNADSISTIDLKKLHPQTMAQVAYTTINTPINDNGDTQLIIEVSEQNLDAVKRLLAAGANPMIQNDKKTSAVDLALRGKSDTIKELICAHYLAKLACKK